MALEITLFHAVAIASHLRLDGQNVSRSMRLVNGELFCSIGQDDDWVLPDQIIAIDCDGDAQVRARCLGGSLELHTMKFLMCRPITAADIPGSPLRTIAPQVMPNRKDGSS